MKPRRRRQGSPIESVSIRITFRADKDSLARLLESVPGARVKGSACEVLIEGGGPQEAADEAKALLDRIRAVGSKGFK